ncbi:MULTISPECIES: hypothetical protein [unclassified Mycobacterium]|uniref:hypothetical protein n=1 Tax=unclassified Mycobacterium TaxID=2642494 RepID=UPI0007FB7F18|nr:MULTISPECIES: hypothetical protein [unclassified Mycobacterium]OBG63931.1 hypothetical protein A5703_01495 [Mycobacterium sp. E188]OBH37000.1 hypothetical protein A5691_03075 [Mycobacterium sp. E183]
MHSARAAFMRLYGSGPWHLLILIAGFALLGYVVATSKPVTLWNTHVWWQSIIVWFAAAIVAHDLVLFPIYALLDRLLSRSVVRLPPRPVPVINHIRVPALGAGLTLLVFLPGIIKQGAATYSAATGQTQDPFLGRWLLLTSAMFGVSAAIYAVRTATAHRGAEAAPDLHVGDNL